MCKVQSDQSIIVVVVYIMTEKFWDVDLQQAMNGTPLSKSIKNCIFLLIPDLWVQQIMILWTTTRTEAILIINGYSNWEYMAKGQKCMIYKRLRIATAIIGRQLQ